MIEKSIEENYKEVAERNADALAEHYKPVEPEEKKSEKEEASSESQSSGESNKAFKFQSSASSGDKKKEDESEAKEDDKKEEKEKDSGSKAKDEPKTSKIPEHAKFQRTHPKTKELKLDIREMKHAIDSFSKSSKDLKQEIKEDK